MRALELVNVENGTSVEFHQERLIIAGLTARDSAENQRHVDELVSLGIAAPASIPAFFEIPVALLTQSTTLNVSSAESSGEVELVLYHSGQGWFAGIGSDHTARDVERRSIAASKASCAKPVSRNVLPLDSVMARWDNLRIRSWAGGELYQEGPLSAFRDPMDVVADYQKLTGNSTDGLAMFLGTIPLLPKKFLYTDTFRVELLDRANVVLSAQYAIVLD